MCGKMKRRAIPPLRDAGGGASSVARPESSYRFKPKFILVVAEEFIATNAYRFGINLPEVLVGDMNEVYQTAHIDDRLVVFTEIHFWERSLGHEAYHMSFGASQF